ncbi:hypothetical protein [Rubripirellula reticaptiva]|uniref:Uncharacterized protein n=1 Tax=Rubripirellula reticaptiva TaxID=2528013 RepID=A0A5C6ELR5_9BACT|nr:hypothetical protein [Rubripirellula reticaptiva]TWU49067.1 hypothetical protein Poly59_36800 [Rubripirellula reticaptiva]
MSDAPAILGWHCYHRYCSEVLEYVFVENVFIVPPVTDGKDSRILVVYICTYQLSST